jgi:hypothetical protein
LYLFSLIAVTLCQKLIYFSLEGYQNQTLVSLDTAIQRLNGIIPSILHALSIARKRTTTVPTDNLNTDESAAIYLYTTGNLPNNRPLHKYLNAALRAKDQTVIDPYLPFVKLFITALSKLESVGQIIYRGAITDLSEKYSVGKTFVWSGFR